MTDNRNDSDLRDEADTPSHQGTGGGNMATDMATQAQIDEIDEPEVEERATKQTDLDHGQEYRSQRPRE